MRQENKDEKAPQVSAQENCAKLFVQELRRFEADHPNDPRNPELAARAMFAHSDSTPSSAKTFAGAKRVGDLSDSARSKASRSTWRLLHILSD